jgi:hypothetical protein
MKIAVCTPAIADPTIRWAFAIASLEFPEKPFFISSSSPNLAMARNMLVQVALDKGVDKILFIDLDTIPPKDGVMKLLSHNLPIVGGVYWSKRGCLCAWKDGKPLQPKDSGLEEVDNMGIGFCLIDASVFRKMSPPWFQWDKHGLCEDGTFFSRARTELGIKAYVDHSVKCLHVSKAYITATGDGWAEGFSEEYR